MAEKDMATDVKERSIENMRQVLNDLRVPLTALVGYSDLLRHHLILKKLDNEADSLEEIIDCARKVTATITDLAELTVLQSGSVEMRTQPVDIWLLVKGIAKRENQSRRENCVKVECPKPIPPVRANPERLDRAITNLLGASLRRSGSKMEAVIRVCREGEEAVISVSSHSPSEVTEDLKHVFDEFVVAERGDMPASRRLGLYLAKLVAESLGGRVWANGTNGEAIFSIGLKIEV